MAEIPSGFVPDAQDFNQVQEAGPNYENQGDFNAPILDTTTITGIEAMPIPPSEPTPISPINSEISPIGQEVSPAQEFTTSPTNETASPQPETVLVDPETPPAVVDLSGMEVTPEEEDQNPTMPVTTETTEAGTVEEVSQPQEFASDGPEAYHEDAEQAERESSADILNRMNETAKAFLKGQGERSSQEATATEDDMPEIVLPTPEEHEVETNSENAGLNNDSAENDTTAPIDPENPPDTNFDVFYIPDNPEATEGEEAPSEEAAPNEPESTVEAPNTETLDFTVQENSAAEASESQPSPDTEFTESIESTEPISESHEQVAEPSEPENVAPERVFVAEHSQDSLSEHLVNKTPLADLISRLDDASKRQRILENLEDLKYAS